MRRIIMDLVGSHLGIDRAREWMRTPNPVLRGYPPDYYFMVGKEEDLLRIVWDMLGYRSHGH
jgi:hypothetical protein